MREMLLACFVGPMIAFVFAVSLTVTEELVDSPYDPARLLPIVVHCVQEVTAATSDLARELFDWFTGPNCERLACARPPQSRAENIGRWCPRCWNSYS